MIARADINKAIITILKPTLTRFLERISLMVRMIFLAQSALEEYDKFGPIAAIMHTDKKLIIFCRTSKTLLSIDLSIINT